MEHLRANDLADLPLVVGGRSAGARVACRTATATEAVAVLCVAFLLEPPGRVGKPSQSRLSELEAVRVPTFVVQGVSDPFGIPPAAPGRKLVTVRGDQSLKADLAAVAEAARSWLLAVASELEHAGTGRPGLELR